MNLATTVVIAIIAIAAVTAAVHLLRHPKSGSCGGPCSGCALRGNCDGQKNCK